MSNWPDDRIWDELQTRLATNACFLLESGPILEKSITAMRSFVVEPMQFGRLYLVGDAAHIVPPTGAKGVNLAVADAKALARALVDWYSTGSSDQLDAYSATCLSLSAVRTLAENYVGLEAHLPGPTGIHDTGCVSIKLDNSVSSIADRVRLEREARGWTLADLAARSGVSRAMISKIERCEASPTATVLVRLAGAFDLTLAGLIARAEGDADRLVRSANQPVWRDPASGYLRRQIFERADHPVELVRVDMPAGARVGMPASSYARMRQVVWVIDGELVIEQGGVRHELARGDCLGFGSPADTTFGNESARTCTYLVIVARS